MRKTLLSLVALAAMANPTFGNTTVDTAVHSKYLGSYGFTLGDTPTLKSNVSTSIGPVNVSSTNRFDLDNGAQWYANVSGASMNTDFGTVGIDRYSSQTDNWAALTASKGFNVNGVNVGLLLDVPITENKSGSAAGYVTLSKNFKFNDANSLSVMNRTGIAFNNPFMDSNATYYGQPDGLMGNATSATFSHSFSEGMSGYVTVHHNEALNKKLPSDTSVAIGAKITF